MKIFFLNIIFIITFNLLSFAQSDEEFIYSTSDVQGSKYYIYIENKESGNDKVWIKRLDPEKTIKNKNGKIIKIGGGSTLNFVKINCSDKEYDQIEKIVYSKSGGVISSNDYHSFGNKVIPGSVMSGIFNSVCTD